MSTRWRIIYNKYEADDRFTKDYLSYKPAILDMQSGRVVEFYSEDDANKTIMMLNALQGEHDSSQAVSERFSGQHRQPA